MFCARCSSRGGPAWVAQSCCVWRDASKCRASWACSVNHRLGGCRMHRVIMAAVPGLHAQAGPDLQGRQASPHELFKAGQVAHLELQRGPVWAQGQAPLCSHLGCLHCQLAHRRHRLLYWTAPAQRQQLPEASHASPAWTACRSLVLQRAVWQTKLQSLRPSNAASWQPETF